MLRSAAHHFVFHLGIGSYGTFSQTSTHRPSRVAVILFPSKTSTTRGSNGGLNWRRPPSMVTGTLWVFREVVDNVLTEDLFV